jgi:threonine synthase
MKAAHFRNVASCLDLGLWPARSQTVRRLSDSRHLEKSGGFALAATDAEILVATRHWAQVEGVFAAPEGAASLVAYQKSLLASSFFDSDDTVVLFNTGSCGLKYLDVRAGQKSNVSNWKKHTGETQYLFGIRWNTTAGFHYGPGLVMAQGLISLP